MMYFRSNVSSFLGTDILIEPKTSNLKLWPDFIRLFLKTTGEKCPKLSNVYVTIKHFPQ